MMLMVMGTVALTWYSPLFRFVRFVLMESMVVRAVLYTIGSLVWRGRLRFEGRSFSVTEFVRKAKEQKRKLSKKSTKDLQRTSTELILRFIVYENQRWWLGLDWTIKLFPNERTPWY